MRTADATTQPRPSSGPAAYRLVRLEYGIPEFPKCVYDGDHCIAEYDGSDNQLQKYIYGPGVDQPICMIDVNDSNATYYYHFDALGSVVALSDADGDTVEVYEYDVYGQVAASDPNHPNPFLFTGRRYDTETGLYYYRARYYNPSLGRFLQTDPIGYGDGMNIYAYCGNNAVTYIDPSGEAYYSDNDWAVVCPGSRRVMRIYPRAYWLKYWYAMGSGETLWYGNVRANNSFAAVDSEFMDSMREAVLEKAKETWWRYKDTYNAIEWPITKTWVLAGVNFDTSKEGSTHYLINGANPGVWFDGKITIKGNRMLIMGNWLFLDWMDLHPNKYQYDNDYALAEYKWDTWVRDGLGGPDAQPYTLGIDLGYHEMLIVFDENGEGPGSIQSGWLDGSTATRSGSGR